MWIKDRAKCSGIISFSRFCFGTWLFGLLIILWGAWVRISHSGDGCGASWPSCDGQYLISLTNSAPVWIEWIHRATSGLFGLSVLCLVVAAFMKFPRGHSVRHIALLALLFTVLEALIGARLVLGELTGDHISLSRVLTMSVHLLNSLLLMGSLFICYRLSLGKIYHFRNISRIFAVGTAIVFFVIAFFGSLSALSVSIFPSVSLWQGMALDFDSGSHWLIRWRFLHPLLGIIFAGGLLVYIFSLFYSHKVSESQIIFTDSIWRRGGGSSILVICLCVVFLTGSANLLLLSPVVLKLGHLLSIYLLAMSFLLLCEKNTVT